MLTKTNKGQEDPGLQNIRANSQQIKLLQPTRPGKPSLWSIFTPMCSPEMDWQVIIPISLEGEET